MNRKAELTMACLTDAAPEQMLVVAAKNGDEQAFETLFKRHRQKVLHVVLRYAHVREDAEDIVQQSFQKAFIYLHRFEGKSSFSTWLTRIAINEALMLLRQGRTLRKLLVDDPGEAEGSAASLQMPDSSPDPETSYMRREGSELLYKALETGLSPVKLKEFRDFIASLDDEEYKKLKLWFRTPPSVKAKNELRALPASSG